MRDPADDRGLFDAMIGDGRSLLIVTALFLLASGAFAVFQAATGHFLPQDAAYLGMSARELCALHGCRILQFMIHDRVSFGGVLIGVAVMYLWLCLFPLRRGESWGWWALAASGSAGFLSFLAYLGYGYLDTWHGAATLALLPMFVAGLIRTRALRQTPIERPRLDLGSAAGIGRALLLLAAFGIIAGGVTITIVGMTSVFVPQDLEFMQTDARQIGAINTHLIPLIAHDRAGFGGALVSSGIAMFVTLLWAPPSRSLWQALTITGAAGFGAAIGVHPAIGYVNVTHLGPAVFGACVFVVGLALTAPKRAGVPITAASRSRRSTRTASW